MIATHLTFILLLLIPIGMHSQPTRTISTDQEKIDQTIQELFKAICFKKDTATNMRDLIPIFIEGGLLIDYNGEAPIVLTVGDFVDDFEGRVRQGLIQSLDDREVRSFTSIYGKIAHRTSYYEARHSEADPEPFARGVNSIQLIRESDSWKVASMSWNDDTGMGFFLDTPCGGAN